MTHAPADLVRLLRDVPTYYGRVLAGLADARVYDDALELIAVNRSDDFAEWDHLAMICRQERALARAAARP